MFDFHCIVSFLDLDPCLVLLGTVRSHQDEESLRWSFPLCREGAAEQLLLVMWY